MVEMGEARTEVVLSWLPKRLVDKLQGPVGGRFYLDQSGNIITVMYVVEMAGWMTNYYVGVAVKSPQDKFDVEIGTRIALCRCLRRAGLLPARKGRQPSKRERYIQSFWDGPDNFTKAVEVAAGLLIAGRES